MRCAALHLDVDLGFKLAGAGDVGSWPRPPGGHWHIFSQLPNHPPLRPLQWAAFFSDCFHEVLPVDEGCRVTLAYELFWHPGEPAEGVVAGLAGCWLDQRAPLLLTSPRPSTCACYLTGPANLPTLTAAAEAATTPEEHAAAVSSDSTQLLRTLGAALGDSTFMPDGGRLGFACQVGAIGGQALAALTGVAHTRARTHTYTHTCARMRAPTTPAPVRTTHSTPLQPQGRGRAHSVLPCMQNTQHRPAYHRLPVQCLPRRPAPRCDPPPTHVTHPGSPTGCIDNWHAGTLHPSRLSLHGRGALVGNLSRGAPIPSG